MSYLPFPGRRPKVALGCLVVLLTGGLAASASASPRPTPTPAPPRVVVTDYGVSTWQGQVRRDGRPTPTVPDCAAVHCDKAKLSVRLNPLLKLLPGGVQVAIRFPDGLFGDSLALYAYRNGAKVASSTGQVGTAQSLLLPKNDADYDLYVAYNPFIPEIAADLMNYQGRAEFEPAVPVWPVRKMLPDLVALSQRTATFDTPSPIFGDEAPAGSSCFNSEIHEQGAHICLRFAQRMANVGDGPVDMRWSSNLADKEDEVPAAQRVYRSDGTYTDRPTGVMHYHPIHDHYHLEDFAQSELFRIGADGKPTGTAVASGKKNGFCMADTELYWWDRKGDAPQSYPAPRCLDPQEVHDGRGYFKNGISRGWADEYGWDLPDQMIEVSNVADGDYLLVTRVDPTLKIQESNDNNNCIMIKVRLKDIANANRSASLISDATPCS